MIDYQEMLKKEETLDPENWEHHKALMHKMVDDVFLFLTSLRDQPVWRKPPEAVKDFLKTSLPLTGQEIHSVYADFCKNIFPYYKGNIHPLFFSWVEGNGTITGVMADMLASAMNSNLAIGDHGAVYAEHQVIEWCREIVGLPEGASGVMTGGGSLANVTALIAARNTIGDGIIKKRGHKDFEKHLVVYCSTETHNCVFKAVEASGIGTDYLRKIRVNANYQIDIAALTNQIEEDKESGYLPFCIVGNAGTVNTGAIDDLSALSAICKKEGMWLHVDGAIGAVANLLPEFRDRLKGLSDADSIAFDLHKWLYINYEAGCLLVRNTAAHKAAFAQQANYLSKHERGLAAGPDSFSCYGLELSRGFKSLKVWMNLKENGIEKYARLIRQNIAQAYYMESEIKKQPLLQMLTPVSLNIVCFRFAQPGMDDDELNLLNKEILIQLQEQGIAAPSYTILNGKYAIRLSITNHRTKAKDLDKVITATIDIGRFVAKTHSMPAKIA